MSVIEINQPFKIIPKDLLSERNPLFSLPESKRSTSVIFPQSPIHTEFDVSRREPLPAKDSLKITYTNGGDAHHDGTDE